MLDEIVPRETSLSDIVLPRTSKRSHSSDSEYESSPKRHASETIRHNSKDEAETPLSLLSYPFSDKFFDDMANTIAQTFPIPTFADTHNCKKRDVMHALQAVVEEPLRNPQSWHEGMSVSEHAQILIADWRSPTKYTKPPGNEETSSSLLDALGSQQSPILIADDEYDPYSPVLAEESPPRIESASSRPYDPLDEDYGPARRQLFKKGEVIEDGSVSSIRSVHSESGWVPINSSALGSEHRPVKTKKTPALDESSDESTLRESISPTKQKSIQLQEKTLVTRVHCRKTASGSWIPAHEWIEGYHQPANEPDNMSGD